MEEVLKKYSNIVLNSFLKIKEGDSLSINTEESDFEFAKIIGDMAVRITKTVVKIVLTDNGKPMEVVDFDPYDIPVQPSGFCMLHLHHVSEKTNTNETVLDIIVDKDDLKAVQKLGHLAEPIILDRRIAIPWCVVPSYNINSKELPILVEKLSSNIDDQILAAKYRAKYLNHADIDTIHFFSDSCDFTLDLPEGVFFNNGITNLRSGRDFISGIDFQHNFVNVDKNSITGFFNSNVSVFGKVYQVKFEFDKGVLVNYSGCDRLKDLLSFDDDIGKPGCLVLNDKYFAIEFGGASVDSISKLPDVIEDLPTWFNNSLYKFTCVLDDKLNAEYIDCNGKTHELIRKGFFLE